MSESAFNLDKLAAQSAQCMVKRAKEGKSCGDQPVQLSKVKKPVETLERLVTKTLGVLQAQGIYAMILFLYSRTGDEKTIAEACIRPELFQVLEYLPIQWRAEVPGEKAGAQTALIFYSNEILDDLDTLLLVRDLYEQTLIYARYGAKAVKGE